MKDGFLIIPNTGKEASVRFCGRVSEYLKQLGIPFDTIAKADNGRALNKKNYDFVIILGGDGTVLEAIHNFNISGIPVIGVNFGRLGYLCTCEPEDAFRAIKCVLDGEYKTENRIMLSGRIIRDGKIQSECFAVNEITLHRGTANHSLNLDLSICGEYIDSFRSDGILVSTPTGSTAYNLSAGGPVVSPEAECFIITHICAHTFKSCPIVTAATDTVEIRISDDICQPILIADSCSPIKLLNGDTVEIRKSEKRFKTVKLNNGSFYQTLRKKMSD